MSQSNDRACRQAPGVMVPVIDRNRCTNCMECIDFCLFGVYGVDQDDRILVELPDNCRKASTRAFLLFLELKGWLASATEIERKAIQAGRAFSSLRFPP